MKVLVNKTSFFDCANLVHTVGELKTTVLDVYAGVGERHIATIYIGDAGHNQVKDISKEEPCGSQKRQYATLKRLSKAKNSTLPAIIPTAKVTLANSGISA